VNGKAIIIANESGINRVKWKSLFHEWRNRMATIYEFTSTLFEIEPGEDEEINPRMYGRQLAAWLKAQLEARGYDVKRITEENWGRSLICFHEPFMFWVGCGSFPNYDTARPGDPPPAKEDVVWFCYPDPDVQVPLYAYGVLYWKRIFRKSPDTSIALSKLDADLRAILHGEPGITLIVEGES
jgi:hypothetical protein